MTNKAPTSIDTVTTGVDWISATLGREELDDQTWVYDAIHALELVALAGNKYNRRSMLGFDGWECAGCFVGSNDKMHYAQFAGKWANDAYHMLEHPKVHISRIDLQVTVQYHTELQKEGQRYYVSAQRHNQGLPEHRQRKINLFIGSDGGDTVYVGSPSSDTRARIYNKQRQSGADEYERCWRFEVVYKDRYANYLFRKLPHQDDARASFIISTVSAYMRERGVKIRNLGARASYPIELPKTPPSDVDTKLKWLREQVMPTIRVLAEMGYADEVGEMLSEALYMGVQSLGQS